MRKLTAIITAYNRVDFVDKCVRSVLAAANGNLAVRVIVMDNGSADDTAAVARAAGDGVEVVRTEDNRHIVEVINRGFARAYEDPDVDYLIVMNEDTEFTPGSLSRLIDACDAHPGSLLTPLQLNYRTPEHLDDHAFGHVQQVRPFLEDAILGRPLKQVYPLPTIIGAAMFARRAVWERIGEFDPLFWFYGIDDDICTRARWLGYETLLVPEAHLYHAHGKLDAQPKTITKAARLAKWRNETQARFLFILKNPGRSFARNVVHASLAAAATAMESLVALWPAGAWHTLRIYGHLLARLPRIAAARRRHFGANRETAA
jgi:GT2 family glycosyltransferase